MMRWGMLWSPSGPQMSVLQVFHDASKPTWNAMYLLRRHKTVHIGQRFGIIVREEDPGLANFGEGTQRSRPGCPWASREGLWTRHGERTGRRGEKGPNQGKRTLLILLPRAENQKERLQTLLGKLQAKLQTFFLEQLLCEKMWGIYYFYTKPNADLLWG